MLTAYVFVGQVKEFDSLFWAEQEGWFEWILVGSCCLLGET